MAIGKLEFEDQPVVVGHVWGKEAIGTLERGKVEVSRDGLVTFCFPVRDFQQEQQLKSY